MNGINLVTRTLILAAATGLAGALPPGARQPVGLWVDKKPDCLAADTGGRKSLKTIDDHRLQGRVKTPSGPSATSAARGKSLGEPRGFMVSAYCPCRACCGPKAHGMTASGRRARRGLCAADPSVPFGTAFRVPGYGIAVVADRGGAIRGNRLDVFFPTHAQALAWGRQELLVGIAGETPATP